MSKTARILPVNPPPEPRPRKDVDHPADVHDPDNALGLADKVEIAAGRKPDTLKN
jgi:hypothetical protein